MEDDDDVLLVDGSNAVDGGGGEGEADDPRTDVVDAVGMAIVNDDEEDRRCGTGEGRRCVGSRSILPSPFLFSVFGVVCLFGSCDTGFISSPLPLLLRGGAS